MPFLQTKLHRPAVLPHQVQRPQLLMQLTQGLASGHSLTLVIAPAGFGKTTLVSQWIDDLHLPLADAQPGGSAPEREPQANIRRVAWLSLDEDDNDLGLFLGYMVAAIQSIFPTAGISTAHLLQGLPLPPVQYVAMTLLSELTALPADFILVLDDYHLIVEATIHQLVARLLEHLPRQIHLVLTSRTEPPLSLARRRVQQQMTELRTAELCFSRGETQAFLTQALSQPPAAETITTLHVQTEGWVAGLQLAALALRGRADEQAFVRGFAANNRHVMDYLMEEVLARQPQAIQAFLMRTSILDRFCTPLSEAVVGEGASEHLLFPFTSSSGHARALASDQPMIAYLQQANLFVVPLDDQGNWVRYHHLFRILLRHHLQTRASAVEIARLHRQASTWLANHGWIEEALQHALAAGDDLAAAQLVEHRHVLLDREEWRTLERWLALLPAPLVRQRPALILTQAFILAFHSIGGHPSLVTSSRGPLSQRTTERGQHPQPTWEINTLWSQIWYWQNEGQRSLTTIQQALEQLPPEHLYVRSFALLCLGFAAYMTGESILAVQSLQAALKPHLAANTFTIRVLFALTIIHYLSAALTHMQQTAQDFWQMATQAHLGLSIAWGHYLLGVVHYEWNELETAAHHFSAVVGLRYSVHVLAVHNGWLGLAWTYQAQGRVAEAQQQIEALLHFHRELNHLALLPATYAFQARLALQQGDRRSALRWAQAANLEPAHDPLMFFEVPQLTRAKILLDQATAASMEEASLALAQLRQIAERTHNTVRLIELLALQALAAASQGHTEQALATLQQSVVLAKPGRFIRTFVDLGPRLAGLLYQLAARYVEPEYLGQVLAAFPLIPDADDLARRIRQATQTTLIEPLTARESEVLMYLEAGLRNKAIAQALNISLLTVKRHTTNLYQKLSSANRKQVVARARALGILPLLPPKRQASD